MDNTIKITSLNCRRHGLCSLQIPWVFANTDVLLCQEISTNKDINIVENQITGLEKDLNCKIYFSDIASDVRLVTFVKNKLKKYVRFEQVAVGRATCLQLQNEDYNYNIINVYGPAYHSPTDYIKFCESIYLNILTLTQTLYLWETGTALWMIPCAPALETTNIGNALGKCSVYLKTGLIFTLLLNLIIILLMAILTTIDQDLTGQAPNKLRSKNFFTIIFSP